MENTTPYKPSVYYFRKALRESGSHERAVVVGLIVCHELEQLKAWVRSLGLIPPKRIVLDEEAFEKGWGGSDIEPEKSEVIHVPVP